MTAAKALDPKKNSGVATVCVALLAVGGGLAMAGGGISSPAFANPRLFASVEACARSGRISLLQCEQAFRFASEIWRERAPAYVKRVDCAVIFKVCDRTEAGWRPAAIGAAITMTRRGIKALPVLAVDTSIFDIQKPVLPAAVQVHSYSPFGALTLDWSAGAGRADPALVQAVMARKIGLGAAARRGGEGGLPDAGD